MITRIVKMTFRKDVINTFRQIFETRKARITAFEGCEAVQLLQDVADPRVFFTISTWDTEEHLNAYRDSDFFGETWGRVKQLFDDKPEAWTTR